MRHLNLWHIPLLAIWIFFASCNGQKTTQVANAALVNYDLQESFPDLGKHIRSIFQDKKGNYWFACDGEGVYRYDGKTATHYGAENGLASNYVRTVTEDKNGYLWFSCRDGISRFDGQNFRDFTDEINKTPLGTPLLKKGSLFFDRYEGIGCYDGESFSAFNIHPESFERQANNNLNPYAIYCSYEDKAGNIWFGTESKGVCRFDGKSMTWFSDNDLAETAVRGIFEDKNGVMWFGSSGLGVFRHDPAVPGSLSNFTNEKGVANADFIRIFKYRENVGSSGTRGKVGTMSGITCISGDRNGDVWIGTFDSGVWRYNGEKLTNYTTSDGLPGNSVCAIYCDKNGNLLVGTYGEGVCRFSENRFTGFK